MKMQRNHKSDDSSSSDASTAILSRGEETRERVLQTGERMLGESGYTAMSMAKVAGEAGITKATLYHHFAGGKDELIVAVAGRMLQRHSAGIARAIAEAQTARAQLEGVASWIYASSSQSEQMLRDASRFLPADSVAQLYQEFILGFYAPIEATLNAGIASGEFRAHDTNFTTCAFLSLLAGFDIHKSTLPSAQLARQVVELLIAGIG